MDLVVVFLILVIWAGYGIVKACKPTPPPVKDWDEHLKYLMSLPDQKARRKYLRNRKPGDK